ASSPNVRQPRHRKQPELPALLPPARNPTGLARSKVQLYLYAYTINYCPTKGNARVTPLWAVDRRRKACLCSGLLGGTGVEAQGRFDATKGRVRHKHDGPHTSITRRLRGGTNV